MARADRMEPTTSNRPPWSSFELPTATTLTTKATTAKTAGMANSHGQVNQSIIADEKNRPRMPPAPAKPAQMPTARARCSVGNEAVITDNVIGMIIAAPTPATTRAISNHVDVVASAAPTLAAAKTASPVSRTRLRPNRSPIAPIGRSNAASTSV